MKYSITLFVDSSLFGGIESHILELAKLLLNQRVPVTVLFCKDRDNQQFYQALDSLNCPYQCLNGKLTDLHKYLTDNPHTIIHSHGYRAGITARVLCYWLKRPCVSTFHAGETGLGKVRFYNWLDKLTSVLSRNLVVSDKLKTQVHNAQVLDNFVAPLKSKPKNVQTNTLHIGFVGRLSHEKGPDIFAQLAEKNIDNNHLHFDVFGNGPMYQEIQHGFPVNLTLHGHQSGDAFWQTIDILVISSRQEGLPMVMLEAMNRGIPVISCPVGAVNRVIKHGLNGYISGACNAEALDECLHTYLALQQQQKRQLQRLGQQTIHTDFSGQKQLKQLLNFYQSCRA